MEVSSHPTSAGKSKDSARLILFTIVGALACMLALASISSAAPASGEDQYLEQPPVGGGPGSRGQNTDSYTDSLGGSNGTVSEDDVKKKAKKNKKKGATESAGATAEAGPTPTTAAPVTSAATAAKLGPFSRTTALILLGGVGLLLGGLWYFGFIGSGGPGAGGGAGGAGRPPTPPAG